jgi:NitT/TauT family transport system substrate-binding protein
VATKRAVRAIAKATDFCAAEPKQAARLVAAKGYQYDYALQTMKEIPYARWRARSGRTTLTKLCWRKFSLL